MKFLCLLLFCGAAYAEPWIVYGQTKMAIGSNVNPAPNKAGLLGEVLSLPYQVPNGKILRIDSMSLEAYPTPSDPRPIFVIFPWVSDVKTIPGAEIINKSAMLSCAASTQTNTCATRYYIPEKKWLNVTVLLGSPSYAGGVWGWQFYGELLDK